MFFGIARSPFGTFAERSLAANWMCLPLPEGVDDVTAAGIANPAMSSWAALTARAKFVAGESVLILGATGVAGQLAVQVAKRLGARRVVAAGRNPQALEKLKTLGADAVISLDQEQASLVSAFRNEIAEAGVDVVLDYFWGAGGACARSDLAKGTAKGLGANSIYSDRRQCGQDDLAACGDSAQFGARTSGQRFWECIARSNPAGSCGVFPGRSEGAVPVPYEGRSACGMLRRFGTTTGRRHAAGISALALNLYLFSC